MSCTPCRMRRSVVGRVRVFATRHRLPYLIQQPGFSGFSRLVRPFALCIGIASGPLQPWSLPLHLTVLESNTQRQDDHMTPAAVLSERSANESRLRRRAQRSRR